MSKKIILFVCGHNAGRSQMAEAYFNHKHSSNDYQALSAGTHPVEEVNPMAIKVLRQENISTDQLRPKQLTPQVLKSANKVYTMGCGVDTECLTGSDYVDIPLPDPHGLPLKEVNKIFQELKAKIDLLANTL